MRLFFTGAHGTGKTTLVEQTASLLPSYTIFNSLTSKFLKNKEDQLPSSPNFMEFQQRLYLYTLNLYVNEDNFISSRSTLDMNAYITSALKGNTLKEEQKNTLKNLIILSKNFNEYLFNENSIYFYLPIEFEINDNNPNRIVDELYQKEIDEHIIKELKEFNISYIELKGTINERMNIIKKILKEKEIIC